MWTLQAHVVELLFFSTSHQHHHGYILQVGCLDDTHLRDSAVESDTAMEYLRTVSLLYPTITSIRFVHSDDCASFRVNDQ